MTSAATGRTDGINKWLGLVAASFGLFLASLDITVNVALPDITSDLGTDIRTIQWIIVFYVLKRLGPTVRRACARLPRALDLCRPTYQPMA